MANKNQPLQVSICSNDADALASIVSQHNFVEIVQSVTNPGELNPTSVSILLADPNKAAQFIHRCSNLTWMQSTWAGNAPLVRNTKRDYTLTVAKNVFDVQIREYVFTYLLAHVRKTFAMNQLQCSDEWQQHIPNSLAGKTLGILGTGSLAKALLPIAQAFNLRVVGVSRRGQKVAGFEHVYCLHERFELAQESDFVVNLLPETNATIGCLDSDFFAKMKADSLLINAGRGSAINEQDLLYALEQHRPSTAVLDVFNTEPLPDKHPFWRHQQVHITHHTAAITQIEDIAALFLKNVERFAQNTPLEHTLDWQQGY